MQDYLDSVGETEMKSYFLDGGIKGWVKKYQGKDMDYFDASAWTGQLQ
jgi:arsenical-resistance protein 2